MLRELIQRKILNVIIYKWKLKTKQMTIMKRGNFPGGPVAKTLHSQKGDPGLTPGQGTRSHMPQLRVCMPQLRPGAARRMTE